MKLADMKKTVIVPFDFSDLSCAALEKAVELVADTSLLRVVHVAEYPTAFEYGATWEVVNRKIVVERVKQSFKKKLETISAMPDLDITVIFGNNPGKEICNFAKDLGAELILIPSHGRTGFDRFLLGSVAERVVRFAPCPVMVLRHDVEFSVESATEHLAAQNN